jgi:thymidylate synthase
MTYSQNEKELIGRVFLPLKEKLQKNDIILGTVELINAHLIFDPKDPYINLGSIKRAPKKYIEKELRWYLSKNRNITGYVDDIEIWNKIASDNKTVNSNYGWCVYSIDNGTDGKSQFNFALKQLFDNPDGRQSVIFYNRPQMQWEWNDNIHAKHDFTCTFVTQHFIRNNKFEYIVYMRSNDAVFGLVNDFAWHCYVYEDFIKQLKVKYPTLEYGYIHWNAGSLHIYERHWELLNKVVDEYNNA